MQDLATIAIAPQPTPRRYCCFPIAPKRPSGQYLRWNRIQKSSFGLRNDRQIIKEL